ncbi:ABC transporter ATP-binding protein [Pusillimonas sp. MFBS29]|uniref:ABC transporter ATP-binding protein n=1 Tax=Pusillimonas sp. MFBS29 TaxID=2886690 RepID=UPI001D116248|nr:ABC transporter ATP-binding protein [Pusillimonas sp. MFBS29]
MTAAVLTPFMAQGAWRQPTGPAVQPAQARPSAEPSNGTPLLRIRDLKVSFDTGTHLVPVLHGVDLELARGETLGVVGESGCGKSVTWMAVMQLLGSRALIEGEISLDGRNIANLPQKAMTAIRGRRIAMIFQDPSSSLNPVKTVGKQLMESVTLHRGLKGDAARAEAIRLLDRVHIPSAAQRMRSWPHELSGGMNQRVMIAMALAGQPELLVADEPTTALDVTIQAQILDLLQELQRDTGMGLVVISHDLGVIAQVCDRVMVMYAGRVVEKANAAELFKHARHPYTQGLIGALPDLEGPIRRLEAIPGTVPAPTEMPAGCSFAPRCSHRMTRCQHEQPVLMAAQGHHFTACWKPYS